MPTAEFGESVDFSASKFIKLKSKGDKIQFRILKSPYYDGKHFMEDSTTPSGWKVTPCPRINDKAECETCEMFFKAHKSAKKDGLSKKDTSILTSPFKVSVSFYFPVVNRGTGKFEVFQTTQGVRRQIEAKRELGTKILERDFIVVRTETPGSGYYSLDVVDSADTKKFSKEEKLEADKGMETSLDEYINGVAEDTDF